MLCKITFNKHKILGDLSLDFLKSDSAPYRTVVFAGENGSGKTSIMKSLSTFMSGKSVMDFSSIVFEKDNKKYVISPPTKKEEIEFGHSYGLHYVTVDNHVVMNMSIDESRKNNMVDLRLQGFAFSAAKSGFSRESVSTIGSKNLDVSNKVNDLEGSQSDIKSLFVDLNSKDANEWLNISKNNIGISFNEFELNRSRMSRFKHAFDNFFFDTGLRFDKIDDTKNNLIDIVFSRNGKYVSIDDLSTGEKQIVFRGANLLRNRNQLKNGIVLIDEPELSLHPLWQKKILKFYRDIFTIDGIQTAQILFATHSENVLESALYDKDNCLVIILKNNSGVVSAQRINAPFKLNCITQSEINYLAFHLYTNDYHIQLYAKLQEKYGTQTSIKNTDNCIKSEISFNNMYIKTYTFGSTVYDTLPTYIRNCIDHPDMIHSFSYDELCLSIEFMISIL